MAEGIRQETIDEIRRWDKYDKAQREAKPYNCNETSCPHCSTSYCHFCLAKCPSCGWASNGINLRW